MLAECITAFVLCSAPPPAPPKARDFTEVRIPRIHEREVIRTGTSLPILNKGVGRLTQTGALISLWGHRATPTNGRTHGPFYFIDRLRHGDEIILTTKDNRRQKFIVYGWRIVRSTAWHVFRPRHNRMLTISACTKKDGTPTSAKFRYVVFAKEA